MSSRALLDSNREPYDLKEFATRVPPTTPIGVYTNKEAESINDLKLAAHGQPIVHCWAKHFSTKSTRQGASQRSCLESKENLKLERLVKLSIGAPVMLLGNLATELGLVNGSIGTVYDILYNVHANEGTINPQATLTQACNAHPMLAIPIVLVQFPSYKGESFLPYVPHVVPILTTKETNSTNSWVRQQLSLRAAYAMTIHKLQGMTLSALALDLSNASQRGLAYVGI